MICPFCWLIDKKKIELTVRQTSAGEDYGYCACCKTAFFSHINPGEKNMWCFDCGQTTVHDSKGKCKCCGKVRKQNGA